MSNGLIHLTRPDTHPPASVHVSVDQIQTAEPVPGENFTLLTMVNGKQIAVNETPQRVSELSQSASKQ